MCIIGSAIGNSPEAGQDIVVRMQNTQRVNGRGSSGVSTVFNADHWTSIAYISSDSGNRKIAISWYYIILINQEAKKLNK